jgi:hypothetical protein
VSPPTGPAGADLLASTESRGLQDRLLQASERAAYLSHVSRSLSGALHTDRAVDLVLEMLTGPVVEWAQMTLVDGRQLRFRGRHVGGGTSAALLPGRRRRGQR